ncbi:MAG: hypothetical protein L6V89_09505 [Oscillospiraceae bacterium]|nr:MAG: hypothetical protein L6V89_09505 [Oscillospiraceae bacterium]
MDMHKYIDEHRDAMVSDLKTLLRIPSVEGEPQPGAPFGSEVRRALDTALEMCRKLGLHAVNVDGYAGYAEIPGCTGEQIGVLTHLDVVPCGKGWSYPPFDAYEKRRCMGPRKYATTRVRWWPRYMLWRPMHSRARSPKRTSG